jgi:S1-C subfamily serine protease
VGNGGVSRPWRSARTFAILFAVGLLLTSCSTAGTTTLGSPSPSSSPAAATLASSASYDPSTEPIVQTVKLVTPAVVTVTSRLGSASGSFGAFGGTAASEAIGTGFIVRSDGIILTNAHVVEGATGVTVAVGYALDLTGGPSVTSGIISSVQRTVQAQDASGAVRTYRDVLQTDAALNPGNSGGPLVTLDGKVVGVNVAGSTQAENIGFAVAIDAAKPLLDSVSVA